MAQGLTPELIGAGGCCRAVSHQPRIQPRIQPPRHGQEGRNGGRQGGMETAPSHACRHRPAARDPPASLPLPPAAQGGDESEFQRR